MNGYGHRSYAFSLAEFGEPMELAGCGGWILKRPVPQTPYFDAMGGYPLFCCQDGSQLGRDLDKPVAANHRNYSHYRRELDGLPGVNMVMYDESEFCNYQYVVLEIEAEAARLDRDTLVKLLWAENVLARRYFTPGCHRMEPYCSSDPGAGRRLPVTEWMTGRLLSLPTGTAVRLDEIGVVCAILRLAIAHADELRQRLDQPEPQLSR